MGILNITPDSFSDGGKYYPPDQALQKAAWMIEQGADILDIGAESSRPGYVGVSAEEEWARLAPVLKALIPACPIPISVDTQKAAVAEKALDLGVHMINDIWGLQKDADMAKVIARTEAAVVIMHNQATTEYQDIISDILGFWERSLAIAFDNGITEDRIVFDPGIGFGKTVEQNVEVLTRLAELSVFPYPILLGVSRKSVIGKSLNLPMEQRLEPTIALGTLGIAAGIDILRVHDVGENKNAARMADVIIRGKRG